MAKRKQTTELLNYGVKHIAFIMDGNGRWAKKRMRPRNFGHAEGAKRIFEIALDCSKRKIEVMSCYAFSTENWNRPQSEIDYLFKQLEVELKKKVPTLMKENIKLVTMGDITRLPLSTQKAINEAISETSANSGLILNMGLNYGSYDEIIRGFKNIAKKIETNEINSDDIDAKMISDHLYTAGYPPLDLLIRTSGEMRLSNFMLWQLAYTELIFTPVYWPDYTPEQLELSLQEFSKRKRRYGGLDNE